MEKKVCGIIIKTNYQPLGDTSSVEIFGKTMLQWVSLAIKGNVMTVDYNTQVDLISLIKPYIDKESYYTVVLYSDTPLITAKTVNQAIAEADKTSSNVIKMTRGYVFKTDFISQVDTIYSTETHYYDEEDFITAFSNKQVALINEILRNRILNYHMERGVLIEDVASTFIGSEVSIGRNVRIAPNNIINGVSVIKDNVRIDSGNNITDCVLDEGSYICSTKAVHSYIGKRTQVGPFANIRANSVVGDDCRIGNFVELKKCKIDNGCKIGHLSYVGDVIMGKACNVGAGVVFANYDGAEKHTTVVGDGVFVGSKATVVAPCTIGNKAYIAAHSIITKDVSENALAIGRALQTEKKDWQGNKYDPEIKN